MELFGFKYTNWCVQKESQNRSAESYINKGDYNMKIFKRDSITFAIAMELFNDDL